MRCEVCGREIRGPPFRRVIEGAKMMVCEQCAPFGDAEWTPAKPRDPPTERRPRSEFEALERLELVENYGERIREARQRENMTVEELAKKLAEKESVVKNLEKEELIPDQILVQKIKKVLRIDLLVPAESTAMPRLSKPSNVVTLGDVIKLRTNPKEKPGEGKPEEG